MKFKIRELAEKKGISLYQLSFDIGLVQQTVYSWATGRTFPTPHNLDILCTYFDCEIGTLLEAEKVEYTSFPKESELRKMYSNH